MPSSSPTLRQFRYLLALEETKHFRQAAEACDISQPSLSVQIQNLEETLGTQLVERNRGGVVLTPVGREVAARARGIVDGVQEVIDLAAGSRHDLIGTIRLGAKPTGLGPYLLPHVVARLHKAHPDLKLYVREGTPRVLEQELGSGVHDVILAQLPLSSADLVAARLFREPLYLVMAQDHPLAQKDSVVTSDLKGLQILSLSQRYYLFDHIDNLCREFGASMVQDYEGTSLDALRQMVGMGMGVTLLPALYVRSEIGSRSEVVVRRIENRSIARTIGLAWRRTSGRGETYREIADLIVDVCARKFKDLIIDR